MLAPSHCDMQMVHSVVHADPYYVNKHGVTVPFPIFHNTTPSATLPTWRTARGTNVVQAYHSVAHHLLLGSNNSVDHAELLYGHENLRLVTYSAGVQQLI
jgi:hypothetical protein